MQKLIHLTFPLLRQHGNPYFVACITHLIKISLNNALIISLILSCEDTATELACSKNVLRYFLFDFSIHSSSQTVDKKVPNLQFSNYVVLNSIL